MQSMPNHEPFHRETQASALGWPSYAAMMKSLASALTAAAAMALIALETVVDSLTQPIVLGTIAALGLPVLLAAAILSSMFLLEGAGQGDTAPGRETPR